MRHKLIASTVAVFLIAAVILAAARLSAIFRFDRLQKTTTPSNVIVLENAHSGTSSWKITAGKEASTEIQTYASATSVLPGQSLTFYVSSQIPNTAYSINIYQLGWYGGSGGRLMASQTNLIARAQGYYNVVIHSLMGCIFCFKDVKTGLLEANWLLSYVLTVPSSWISGVYLAKFTDDKGLQTYMPFDVRNNSHSFYIAVTPVTTYVAYNDWGGDSLYLDITVREYVGLVEV